MITGNRLSDTNRGDPLELGEALGLDPRFVILLVEDKNFTVENNTIVDALPPGVGRMGIDQKSTSEASSLQKHN